MFTRGRISNSREGARTVIGWGSLRETTIAAKRDGCLALSADEIDVLRIKDLRLAAVEEVRLP